MLCVSPSVPGPNAHDAGLEIRLLGPRGGRPLQNVLWTAVRLRQESRLMPSIRSKLTREAPLTRFNTSLLVVCNSPSLLDPRLKRTSWCFDSLFCGVIPTTYLLTWGIHNWVFSVAVYVSTRSRGVNKDLPITPFEFPSRSQGLGTSLATYLAASETEMPRGVVSRRPLSPQKEKRGQRLF